MAGAPGYTVDEARADAREWIKGTTLHGGSRGWRVCCAILDERIAELEAALAEIHATARRVTHHHEWYLDGVRQTPGEYVIMRVGDAPVMQEPPF